jgi:vacuolar protein sorting-associated protein 13A/C
VTTATTTTTTTTTTFGEDGDDKDDGLDAAARSPSCRAARRWRDAPSEFQSKELGTFEVTLTLDAIGFSLVDHVPQELLFLSFKQLRLAYTESLFDQTLECTVRDMQCDNQMQAAPFPVLFAPNAAARATAPRADVLHLSVVRSKQHTKIFYIKYLSALLRECDLSCRRAVSARASRASLSRYSSALQSPAVANATVVVDGGNGSGASPAADGEADDEGFATSDMQVVYIKLLHLNPIKLFVSFQTAGGAWRAAAVSTPSAVALALGGSGGSGPSVLSSLLTAVAVGANVDRAPLQLNSLFMKNVFSTQSDLVSRIAKHYSFQVISQLYMIIGSFDIIGNPVSLVSTLGTGVYDFFYEPANALVRSPRDFGAGLVKGTSSLVKHAVYGLFDTASKITGSVGMGAAYLSGDHRYVRERGRRVAQRANNVGEGFYLGMRELGTGFVNGMRGVFVQPIADARKDGAAGLIRGVLRGVVGAAIKPTVGLIDFGTRITQGVKNQVLGDGDRVTERVRRARHFGVDGRLEMYSAHHAYGRWLLLSVIEQRPKKQRAAAAAEAYVHHVDMEHGVLLLSNRRLLKVERRRVRVLWEVQLQQIESVETARTQRSSALVVAHSPTAGSAAGDTNALRALFDHHFGLSEDVEHDRVLRSQPRFGGALAAAAAAAPSVVAPAPNNDTLDDDGGALHHRHQEVATATTTVNAAAVPSDAEFDFVLVVRARVQWEGGAAEQSVVAGDAAVAEKRIVFGEEVEQMNVLAKLIVETIQVNRLRVW